MSNPFIFGPPPPPPKSSSSNTGSWSGNRGGNNSRGRGRGGGGRGGRGRGQSHASSNRGGGGYSGSYGGSYGGSQMNTARRTEPETSPSVPAFGALPFFGQPIPQKPVSTVAPSPYREASNQQAPNRKASDKQSQHEASAPKPITNLLGLTPDLDAPYLSSDSEGSTDEEAAAAAAHRLYQAQLLANPSSFVPSNPFPTSTSGTTIPEVNVFSFRGTTLDLRSPEAIAEWIASRKKNFPTKAKVEEKLSQKAAKDEERRKEYEERQRKRKEEKEEEFKRRKLERESRGKGDGTGKDGQDGRKRKVMPPKQRMPPHRKSLYERMRENDLEHENRTLVNLIRSLGEQGYLD